MPDAVAETESRRMGVRGLAARAEIPIAVLAIGAASAFLGLLLTHGRFPLHDTRSDYECFHVFYNSLLYYHELPLWFSGMQYGVPADYDILVHLSPPQFLAAAVGFLFHFRNTLALFYGAMQMEVFVVGLGAYLLGRSLFRNLAPTILLTASLLLSTFYLAGLFWDFRIYIWMPAALFFLQRFTAARSPRALVAAGACLLLGLIGMNPYMPLPFLWVMLALLAGLLWDAGVFQEPGEFARQVWRNLRRDWLATALLALVCLVLAGAWVSAIVHALDYVKLASPSRLANGKVGLDAFLGYGFQPGFGKLMELLFAAPANIDARFFTGYINLVFFLFFLIWARRKMSVVLAGCTLFLVLLSVSEATLAPALFYYLIPGANRFRHIGLLLPIARCLIFIGAAFGLEEALESLSAEGRLALRWLAAITASLLVVVAALGVHFGHELPYTPAWSTAYADPREVWLVSLLAGALFLIWLIRAGLHDTARLNRLGTVAIVAACFELAANQHLLHRSSELFPDDASASTVARPLTARLWRRDTLDPPLAAAAEALLQTAGMHYGTGDVFLGANRCKPAGRTDMRNPWLAGLWDLVGRVVPGQPEANRVLLDDPQAFRIPGVPVTDPDLRDAFSRSLLGCESATEGARPTVFLTRDVRLAGSPREARAAMIETAGRRLSAYPMTRMSIRATSWLKSDYAPAGLLTGANPWIADSPLRFPQTLTLRLEAPAAVSGLEILPEIPVRDWRPRFVPPDEMGAVAPPDYPARSPHIFSFEGSLDGRTWKSLLEESAKAEAPEDPQWRSWRFPNTTPYSFYRLVIRGNGGDPDYLSMQTLRLLLPAEASGERLPDAVIESAPPGNAAAAGAQGGQPAGRVSLAGVSYNSLEVDAAAQSGGWLVRREGWHPGWRVLVDGHAQPVARADLGFQAVWLPAGEHRVVFRFSGNQGFARKYWIVMLLSSSLWLFGLGWTPIAAASPSGPATAGSRGALRAPSSASK